MSSSDKNLTVETATNLLPFASPNLSWESNDETSQKGFTVSGVDNTPGKKALFFILEAKPGKEHLVQGFLKDINDGVLQEPGTGPWMAWRYSKTTFGVFEGFPDAEARRAHINGPGGRNFLRTDLLQEMLAHPAQVHELDIQHGKWGTIFGQIVQPVA